MSRFLLARRLVEAGARLVTCSFADFDWHGKNFETGKRVLPLLDQGVAALVKNLHERILDRNVTVIVWSEFGRTPIINDKAGRDHWPGAMSVVFAGGGLQMGQVVGATNDKAEYPTWKPYTPGSVLATMYHALGIDHKHVFFDHARRPMPILAEGKPIGELV